MYLPEGCTLIPVATNDANGEPVMAVSAPVVALIENPSMSPLFPNAAPAAESMLKPVTLLDPLLATYRNLLPGSMAAATGLFPVVNVPAGVNPFVAWSMANPENWFDNSHSTYATVPEGVFAKAAGPLQFAAMGEPVGVSVPVRMSLMI